MRRVAVLLLVPAVAAACLHRSPEDRVMAAFGEIPSSQPGVCLMDNTAVNASKLVAHVSAINGDTAIVALFQDCIRRTAPCPPGFNCRSGAVRFETDYLVVRRNGKWKLDRALGGATLIAG